MNLIKYFKHIEKCNKNNQEKRSKAASDFKKCLTIYLKIILFIKKFYT